MRSIQYQRQYTILIIDLYNMYTKYIQDELYIYISRTYIYVPRVPENNIVFVMTP